jgi:3-hydroxybutyryl-CoA dehydratase
MREKIEAVEKKRGDCFAVSRTFTEHDTTTFAEITRDYNPVYFDRSFASLKTFNDRICHGLLGGSILTEIGGQIGWLASGMNFLFKKPVYTQGRSSDLSP